MVDKNFLYQIFFGPIILFDPRFFEPTNFLAHIFNTKIVFGTPFFDQPNVFEIFFYNQNFVLKIVLKKICIDSISFLSFMIQPEYKNKINIILKLTSFQIKVNQNKFIQLKIHLTLSNLINLPPTQANLTKIICYIILT